MAGQTGGQTKAPSAGCRHTRPAQGVENGPANGPIASAPCVPLESKDEDLNDVLGRVEARVDGALISTQHRQIVNYSLRKAAPVCPRECAQSHSRTSTARAASARPWRPSRLPSHLTSSHLHPRPSRRKLITLSLSDAPQLPRARPARDNCLPIPLSSLSQHALPLVRLPARNVPRALPQDVMSTTTNNTANSSPSPGARAAVANTTTPDRDHAADSDDSLARKRQRLSEEPEVVIEADEPEEMEVGDQIGNAIMIDDDALDAAAYSDTFRVFANSTLEPMNEMFQLRRLVTGDGVSMSFFLFFLPSSFDMCRSC